MKPSNKELQAATKEGVAAMRQLSADLYSETEAVLKVRASRHRLTLARCAKSALFQDLMAYGEQLKLINKRMDWNEAAANVPKQSSRGFMKFDKEGTFKFRSLSAPISGYEYGHTLLAKTDDDFASRRPRKFYSELKSLLRKELYFTGAA